MSASSHDWISLNPARGGRLECLRCGHHYVLSYPVEAWAMAALSRGFDREHRRCTVKPEGMHCSNCGATGHEPEACPRLDAKTPEQWLDGPDTGMSSRTIYGALHSARGYYRVGGRVDASIPLDPADFGRCHRLLKLFPEWRARLPEVAAKHPEWAALVAAWDELTALYEEELPSGKAPRLYARMRELEGRP